MQPVEIVGRHRLLEPRDPELGVAAGQAHGLLAGVAAVGVDEQLRLRPDRVPDRLGAARPRSRVLVGVADRSVPEDADVTLHQFRALALVAAHDELNVNSLAELLGVSPSTITRLCDRLVRKKLIRRRTAKESRREVCISVSPRGAALVEDVLARRRAAIDSTWPACHRARTPRSPAG